MNEESASGAALPNDAFISYSRSDRAFAEALEKALERYRPPPDLEVPQRHLRVFRDQEDFTGVDYDRAVQKHLSSSRSLIVLCSPAARRSRYVDDEIRKFAAVRGADRIVPVLVDGLPNNEAGLEAEERRAFPEALCDLLGMPLAADYRGLDPKRQKIDRGDYFAAWSTVLANLYDVSRDRLEQRELRRARRARRIAAAAAGSVITLLSVALVVALASRREAIEQRAVAEERRAEAVQQRDRAERAAKAEALARQEEERQRQLAEDRQREAERQRAIAQAEAVAARRETANRLAVQALERLDDAPVEALRLAMRATETFHAAGDPVVPRALEALLKVTISFGGGRPAAPWHADRRPITLSTDLQWAAASDGAGVVRFGRTGDTNHAVLEPPANVLQPGEHWDREPTDLSFSDDRLFAMRRIAGGRDPAIAAWYWDLGDGGIRGVATLLDRVPWRGWGDASPLSSSDGTWISWTDGREAFLRPTVRGADVLAASIGDSAATPLRVFSDDSRLFVLVDRGRIRRWELRNGAAGSPRPGASELEPLETGVSDHTALAVPPTRRSFLQFLMGGVRPGRFDRLALLGASGDAEWWDLEASPPVRHPLPNLFTAYVEDLRVARLERDRVRVSLQFSPTMEGVMAAIADVKGDFGVAAFHLFTQPQTPWRPLLHPNSRAGSRDSVARTSGEILIGPEGPAVARRGYEVRNQARVGVADAAWLGPMPMTIGLDGTLLAHGEESSTPDLVATNATHAAPPLLGWLVVGHRNGKLSLIDLDADREDNPLHVLSGDDSPVGSVRQAPPTGRLASFAQDGTVRVWRRDHPYLNQEAFSRVTADWRWLAVDGERGLGGLWDLRAPDLFASPATAKAYEGAVAAAHDLQAGWIATLHRDPNDAEAGIVRLWSLAGSGPPLRPARERSIRIEGVGSAWAGSLGLAVRGGEARVSLVAGFPRSGVLVDLFSGRSRPLGSPARREEVLAMSDDQRWLLARPADSVPGTRLPIEIVDLRDWGPAPPRRVIPGSADAAGATFDPDSRIQVGGKRLDPGTLAEEPEPITTEAASVTRSEGRSSVARAPGRPALNLDRQGALWASPSSGAAGRWVRLAAGYDLHAAGWHDEGESLTLGDGAGRVWLVHPSRGADVPELAAELMTALKGGGLPLPWDARARTAIRSMRLFSKAGWLAATTEGGGTTREAVLLWFRTAQGTWDEPLVFFPRDLLLVDNPSLSRTAFDPDGHEAVVTGQHLLLDPARLLATARLLVPARSAAARSSE